jgi:hypothetical protein
VADDPTADLAAVVPLPNLDGHVRQGDALLDPYTVAASLAGRDALIGVRREITRAAEARRAIFALAGPAKRGAAAALARAEAELAGVLLASAKTGVEAAIAELLSMAKDHDLFGRRRGLSVEERRRLSRLRSGLRDLRRAARALRRDGGAPFFAFESHFGDVIARGGFDMVLGNPPWVRGERLPARVRETLQARYHTWQSARSGGFAHLPDLSVAFVERSLELTAPGGAAALLVPAKLISSGYAERLRQWLAHHVRLARVAPLDDAAAAFGAAVYPMALVAVRADPAPGIPVAREIGPAPTASTVPQQALQTSGPWILVPDALAIARRLRSAFPAVGDRWSPQLGVKTGADDLFLVRDAVSGARPAVRGRDLTRWCAAQRVWLLWTHGPDGRPLPRLPQPLAERFAPQLERLRRRSDYRGGPPWQLFRTALALASHRVVWPDLARRLLAAVLEPSAVPLNTVYGIATRVAEDAFALAALLNTRWCAALARIRADPARGGFRRFNAGVVRELPLPADAAAWAQLSELGRSQSPADDLVADLLHLDLADRRVLAQLAPDSL